jgi:small subunit ribosomal protein S17
MAETENETTETTEGTPVEGTAAEETPAAEAAEAEAPAAGETATPAQPAATPAQPEPKKKKRRLPRAQRPPKTRPQREPSKERKPLTRQPKPESVRGRRQERRGVVVSDAMDKTIVVKVESIRAHPRYKKVIRRSIKFHAHDEQNAAHVGDIVRIVETRPLSKTKNWRLAEIVEAAK